MSKRTVFTTVTPLPAGISREIVMETLHCHVEMIDLNPLVEERHPIKPPSHASAEEYSCQWYSLTDKVQYLPGGMMSGKVTYSACFHDLTNGVQTHVYAPLGLNIRGKWTLGGSLPGEPVAPVELGLGLPLHGLWLREDVDMKCNIVMTSFVKGTLKKSHATLVDRLMAKVQRAEAVQGNPEAEEASERGRSHSRGSEHSYLSYNNRSRVESWAADAYQASRASSQGSDVGSWKHEEQNDMGMGTVKTSRQAHHSNHSSSIQPAHTYVDKLPPSNRSYSSERSIEICNQGSTSGLNSNNQTQRFRQGQNSSSAQNDVNQYRDSGQAGGRSDIPQANTSERHPIYEMA